MVRARECQGHVCGPSIDAPPPRKSLDLARKFGFARGERILSNTGQPVQLIRPLDFLAITEHAEMLGLAYIRVLEVASFYFMFQLKPVGTVAHFQICGTTSCMICGAEDLIAVCKDKIAANAHDLSSDGKFSWEEVECLGACANAPMVQIGKDYYEDLTAEGTQNGLQYETDFQLDGWIMGLRFIF